MLQAPELDLVRCIVVQGGRGRARPRAVDETEGGVVANIVDQLHHLVEVVFGFARKAHDEIAAHRQVRADGTQLADGAFVFHRGVAALHGHQYPVRAVLHRQVQVVDQLGQPGIGVDQALREFVGVAGDVAYALDAGDVRHVFEQRGEIGDLCRVTHGAAVGVDVLPQQRHFFHTLVGQARHFDQYIVKWPRDLFATRVRHDAVAAVLGAALHDADKGAGAFHAGRRQVIELLDFGEADVDLGFVQSRTFGQQVRQAMQRLGTEHHVNIRRALDDGRAFLAGHATAHADEHAFFLQVLDAAQVAEDFFLRLFTHRAGVEQDQVGFVDILGGLVALCRMQYVGHLVRVILVHLAPEGFDKNFFAHDLLYK